MKISSSGGFSNPDENLFGQMVQGSPDMLYRYRLGLSPGFEYISPAVFKITGYTPEEHYADPGLFLRYTLPEYRETARQMLQGDLPLSEPQTFCVLCKDGAQVWIEHRLAPITDSNGNLIAIQGSGRDVTDRIVMENRLRESERRNQALLLAIPDLMFVLGRDGSYLDYKAERDEDLAIPGDQLIGRNVREISSKQKDLNLFFHSIERALSTRELQTFEYELSVPKGRSVWEARMVALADDKVLTIVRDITERKLAETHLRESEERYRSLFEASPNAVMRMDTKGRITLGNQQLARLYGVDDTQEVIGLESWSWVYADDQGVAEEISRQILETGFVRDVEIRILRKDGAAVPVEASVSLYDTQGQPAGFTCILRDMSERIKDQEQLQLQSTALDAAANAIVITDHNGAIQWSNPAFEGLTGYSAEEAFGRALSLLNPEGQPPEFYRELWETVTSGQVWRGEVINRRKDGRLYTEEQTVTPVRAHDDEITHFIAIKQDLTQRRQREREIQTLHAIDMAINASPDLHLTLNILVNSVTGLLTVDAAAVLMLDESDRELTYAAGQGFFTSGISHARVKVGEGFAGRVAKERKTLFVPDLSTSSLHYGLEGDLKSEGFTCYFGVPLIAKGEIKGVLEIYHRSPFRADKDWLRFLDALAHQTAIAIDNAQLFEGLQRSKTELERAYDTTLEGWAAALELRDQETEGHSHRVVQLTLDLARALGVEEERLVSIRRGALLHDIGKMGIPDSILLKPGPLTVEEWETMRQHPLYAYRLLAPITFLHHALDIPYLHHERWDGSGYPLGLHKDEIPVPARIFAVIDVWDALRSDRPYRPAWDDETVIEYLKEQAGRQFDPRVVVAFLRLIA